jgi:site-specific recombinase XerD
MSESIIKLISQYLDEKENVENSAPATIDTYRGHLTRWAVTFPGELHEVKSDHIKAYQAKQRMNGKGTDTLSGVLSALRGFFAWAQERGLVKDNPAVKVKYPIGEEKLPGMLTMPQIGQLINSCGKDFKGVRDTAIILLLFVTGLRVQSIEQVDRDDWSVEEEDGQVYFTLHARVKRRKQVKVVVHPVAYFFCKLYENMPEFHESPTEAYFVNIQNRRGERRGEGCRLTKRAISRMIRRRAEDLGLEGITAHSLRHSCGVFLYEAGMTLQEIKDWLHHVRLETTEIYTQLARRDKKKGLQSFDRMYALFPNVEQMIKAFKDGH